MTDEYEALAARIIELVDNDRQNPTGRGPEAIIKSWLRDFAASRERAGREAAAAEAEWALADDPRAARIVAARIRGGPESTPDA
jgi:hypothetical protein